MIAVRINLLILACVMSTSLALAEGSPIDDATKAKMIECQGSSGKLHTGVELKGGKLVCAKGKNIKHAASLNAMASKYCEPGQRLMGVVIGPEGIGVYCK